MLSDAELVAEIRELVFIPNDLAGKTGNVAAARGDANAMNSIPEANRIAAEYVFPYLAHTPMEPLNTTIRFDGDKAEVWAGSQFQTIDQMAIAQTLGLKPEQVTFHTEMAGGGLDGGRHPSMCNGKPLPSPSACVAHR